MSGILGYHNREAVRVKVKKCEGFLAPEYRKFSVDPQITSFEVLQSLLARAFDIKGEFIISYLAHDDEGQETYLPLLSDWDLDAAFLSSSEPCLHLKADLRPFEEGLEEWDIISPVDYTQPHIIGGSSDKNSITGTILNHMEKTINLFQRALNLCDNESSMYYIRPLKAPMSDSELHNYLDCEGRLVKPKDLRLSVYQGGIEPSLRKVVWKHILNVYPEGLSGKERMAYMKRKSSEYERLCKSWKMLLDSRTMTEEMQFVTNMVRKDVLRTDRTHKFYAGGDDNKNVASLFNVLTTYALNHPSVSYCQGMSDLASPILVTMKDEAHAYVCFCALMQRLKPNFQLDGLAMTRKFQHLSELLQFYDPQFFEYLKLQGADDLLFGYRWLLLELKREFAFDDALTMLEVLWSSLPPSPPTEDLSLHEIEFNPERAGTQSPHIHSRENPYTKVRALRKQNSTSSIKGLVSRTSIESETSSRNDNCDDKIGNTLSDECSSSESNQTVIEHLIATERRNSVADGESSPDESQEYPPMTTSITRELRIDLENLNRYIPGACHCYKIRMEADAELPKDLQILNQHQTVGVEHATEDDGPDTQSWTSDDQSGDRIHRVGSSRRQRKCLEILHTNGAVDQDSGQCGTPDEQCEIDFDEHTKCSGEILENEVLEPSNGRSCSCHLKSVIPIHLIRSPVGEERHRHSSSDSETSTDSYSSSCRRRRPGDGAQYPPNNQSEGYVSDATVSSKSTSFHFEQSCHIENRFSDSGVVSTPANSCEEALEFSGKCRRYMIPPPQELGDGNPFMLFLCLTLLLQHREIVVRNHMDYNELAMHFDKMVRKHHVQRVLHQGRAMFAEYLQMGWQEESWDSSNPDLQV